MEPVDEKLTVPVFDLEKTRVVSLSIEHILNFVYYSEGQRRPPRGVTVAESIFDATVASHPATSNDEWAFEQLNDSEDANGIERTHPAAQAAARGVTGSYISTYP